MPKSNKGVISYISPDVKERLEKLAAEQDRSISWLVGKWIEEKLSELGR